MQDNLDYKNIESLIIECTNNVWSLMGVGDYEEKHYQKLLSIFLTENNIQNQLEYIIPINIQSPYSNKIHQIQHCRLDILVDESDIYDDKIIIELKRESKLTDIHEEQIQKYLTHTNINLGILINFPKKKEQLPEIKIILKN